MIADEDRVFEEAIRWHLRLSEADRDEWRAFIEWLETAPEHAAVYDRLSLEDVEVSTGWSSPAAHSTAARSATGNVGRRLIWRTAAAVAGAALMIGGLSFALGPAAPVSELHAIATAPGETRNLRFEDGTEIALNGATRLVIDRANPRTARLETGEAMFRVRHDPDTPFSVHSGTIELRDIGTAFNVTRQGKQLTIAVSEGAVMFQPQHEAVVLRAGRQLTLKEDEAKVVIDHVDTNTVGSWRMGWLALRNIPVREAAGAIERATGAHVVVAGDLATQPFTGSIRLAGGAEKVVARFAQLLDAQSSHENGKWILAARQDESPSR